MGIFETGAEALMSAVVVLLLIALVAFGASWWGLFNMNEDLQDRVRDLDKPCPLVQCPTCNPVTIREIVREECEECQECRCYVTAKSLWGN